MTISHYGIPILFMDVELDDHSHIFHVSKVMICTISMMISNALQLNHLFITMIQGLVWLLPFLYFGYLFEIYNAYALYFIYLQVRFEWITGLLLISVQFPDATWHVAAMSILFLMLGLGNIDIIVWHGMPIILSTTNLLQETSSLYQWRYPKNWKTAPTACSNIALPGQPHLQITSSQHLNHLVDFVLDICTIRLDKYFWSHRRRRDSDRQVCCFLCCWAG